jgi:hypothetical protein
MKIGLAEPMGPPGGNASRLLAMQNVGGSSLFIRSSEPAGKHLVFSFHTGGRGGECRRGPAFWSALLMEPLWKPAKECPEQEVVKAGCVAFRLSAW